jgi:aconitase A
VIAANYAFEQLKEKYKENIYGEEVEVTPFEMSDYVDEETEQLINEEVKKEKAEIEKEEDAETPQPTPPYLNPNLSAWARNKALQEWRRKNNNDDLTKTY